MQPWLKRSLWIALPSLAVYGLYVAYQPDPVLVDLATVVRTHLAVTVDDDGQTRLRERYSIHAPIDGLLVRPPLKAGAPVQAGVTVLAAVEPRAPGLLDARARAEADARVESARAAVQQAKAMEQQAQADARFAKAEFHRRRELTASGAASAIQLELAERDLHRTDSSLRAARFAVRIAEHELALAQARVADDYALPGHRIPLHSPIDGHIIRVFEESARAIPAGTPILEVGNTKAIEVVADFLSQDAVAVEPGMEVLVEGFRRATSDADQELLRGRVRLVEPGGFTKISALGVEEQRVNIVVDPIEPLAGWNRLRDGYRVELRVILWQKEDVTVVPTGALFREEGDWAVFVFEGGRAIRKTVRIGKRSGLAAEVVEGLRVGDRVVLYPSDLIHHNAPIHDR